jgi:hypothetical protein
MRLIATGSILNIVRLQIAYTITLVSIYSMVAGIKVRPNTKKDMSRNISPESSKKDSVLASITLEKLPKKTPDTKTDMKPLPPKYVAR